MTDAFHISDLGRVSREWATHHHEQARMACLDTAMQVEARYVQRTHQAGAVDTGRMVAAFRFEPTDDGAQVVNDTVYFNVIDKGRRPGQPGPPFEPILQWVLRKQLVGTSRADATQGGDLYAQAVRLAHLIRAKIHRKGIEARGITDIKAEVLRIFAESVRRYVAMGGPTGPAGGIQ